MRYGWIDAPWRIVRRCATGFALIGSVVATAGLGSAQADTRHDAAPAWTARVNYVVDGDSLWVRSADAGTRVKLRLQGIDAPEICQAYGLASRDALRSLVVGRQVRVTVHAHDYWGRAIASVVLDDGRDLETTMVRHGWAWADRWQRGDLSSEEQRARQAGIGLFAQRAPEHPADFRRRHGPCNRRTAAAPSPALR